MNKFDTIYNKMLCENISKPELDKLEAMLDKIFARAGIDINFTKHFLDRVNDKRNGKPITIEELKEIFLKSYNKYKPELEKLPNDFEAVLNDVQTDINLPFVLKYDSKNKEMDLVSKTVMRKPDFKTRNKKYKV